MSNNLQIKTHPLKISSNTLLRPPFATDKPILQYGLGIDNADNITVLVKVSIKKGNQALKTDGSFTYPARTNDEENASVILSLLDAALTQFSGIIKEKYGVIINADVNKYENIQAVLSSIKLTRNSAFGRN